MAATEAVYLFRKDKRLLMTPSKTLGDYARAATPDEIKDGNPKGERVLILIVRKTDNFWKCGQQAMNISILSEPANPVPAFP